MELIPAIDLRDGRCVRLLKGDFAQETRYAVDPVELAVQYRELGARWLHVVDLDGAKRGEPVNLPLIRRMREAAGCRRAARRRNPHAREPRAGARRGGASRHRQPRRQRSRARRVVARRVRARAPHARARRAARRRRHAADRDARLDARLDADAGRRHRSLRGGRACGTCCAPTSTATARCRARTSRCTATASTRWPAIAFQASGGVRDVADLAALTAAGVAATVSGKALLEGRLTTRGDSTILTRRIIPCLDVRDGVVVKGVQFRDHRVVGDIMTLAARYRDEGADELVFYDITASPDRRTVDRTWVNRIAAVLDIPFCVAGGIRSVADAETVLNLGADKISVNSPALERPDLIDELVRRFGSQCVVIGIDTLTRDGDYHVYQYTGDPTRSRAAERRTLDWVREVQDRGAGEIVLNCMNQDGVRQGYDVAQLAAVRAICGVPLIASGGAGAREHFKDVFERARVDGALAASVFHTAAIDIGDLKRYLAAAGIAIRPVT